MDKLFFLFSLFFIGLGIYDLINWNNHGPNICFGIFFIVIGFGVMILSITNIGR